MENRSLFQSQWVARKIAKLRRKRQKKQIICSMTKTTECKISGFGCDRPFWFTRTFTKFCRKKCTVVLFQILPDCGRAEFAPEPELVCRCHRMRLQL